MDLSFIQSMIPNVAAWLHIDPATLLLLLGIGISTCNVFGRIIPDDATGWRGALRSVCKFIGMYAQNRVSVGYKTSDAVRHIRESQAIQGAAESFGERIKDGLQQVAIDPTVDYLKEEKPPVMTPFERFRDVAESKDGGEPDDAR